MLARVKYEIELPDGFDGYAPEVEAKGWLPDVAVTFDGRRCRVTFYDPARLAQEIEANLSETGTFFESNVVVVARVTRAQIESAVATLVRLGRHRAMVSAEEP